MIPDNSRLFENIWNNKWWTCWKKTCRKADVRQNFKHETSTKLPRQQEVRRDWVVMTRWCVQFPLLLHLLHFYMQQFRTKLHYKCDFHAFKDTMTVRQLDMRWYDTRPSEKQVGKGGWRWRWGDARETNYDNTQSPSTAISSSHVMAKLQNPSSVSICDYKPGTWIFIYFSFCWFLDTFSIR